MSISEIEDWCRVALRICYLNFGFLSRIIFKSSEIKRLMRSAFYTMLWMITKKAQILGRKSNEG
jgi:hypothetical protein